MTNLHGLIHPMILVSLPGDNGAALMSGVVVSWPPEPPLALHNSPARAIFVDETVIVNFVHLYLPVPAALRIGAGVSSS